MSKLLVYVAGPYTNPDPVINVQRACEYGTLVQNAGHVPLVPHLTMLWHLVSPRPYEHWLAYDVELMLRCDAVLRFPGASSGADAEVKEARAVGIPVVYSVEDLAPIAAKRGLSPRELTRVDV